MYSDGVLVQCTYSYSCICVYDDDDYGGDDGLELCMAYWSCCMLVLCAGNGMDLSYENNLGEAASVGTRETTNRAALSRSVEECDVLLVPLAMTGKGP